MHGLNLSLDLFRLSGIFLLVGSLLYVVGTIIRRFGKDE